MNWPVYHNHIASGRYYGYPECCVEFYARAAANGEHGLAQRYGCVYDGPGKQHVPCPGCAEQAIPFEAWCDALTLDEPLRAEYVRGYLKERQDARC